MINTPRDQRSQSSRRALVLLTLLALVVSACDLLPEPPGQDDALPPERPRKGPILPVMTTVAPTPDEDPSATTTTLVPGLPIEDLRTRPVAPVEGKPLPEFVRSLDDGSTTLGGRVVDAAGAPVEGATVRLDRVTHVTEQRTETTTNAEGRWQVKGLSGGRYRVRAWRSPDLAVEEPGAVFIENGGSATVDLATVRPTRFDLRLERAPSLPRVGETTTFVLRATSGSVDSDGRITNVPVPDVTVEFPSTGRWVTEGADSGVTDGDGRANWSAECRSKGAETVTMRAARPASLDPKPASTPAGPSTPPGSTAKGSSPRTPAEPATVRFSIDLPACGDPLPQTSLTAGDTFTVPYPGAIPAGNYRLAQGRATCGFSYDAWFEVGWLPNRATHTGRGVLQLPWPAHDLRRAAGSPGNCVYELVNG